MKNFILVFVLFAVGFFYEISAQNLTILHTNDTHSQIEPIDAGEDKGFGGYERRSVFIDSIRHNNRNVILLDAGDFDQGTPYFTLFKGDAEIELMNILGYDAAAFGNHEFDNGLDELARRVKSANFPFLCANYDFSGTPLKALVEPYTIINKNGLKIGVIGVLTDLSTLVSKKKVRGVKYIQPYEIVDSLANMLKKKCDLVILLSHLGYNGRNDDVPSDSLVVKNTSGIDIVIGGHSHTYLDKETVWQNKNGENVVIVTAKSRGSYVGKLDLWFGKSKRN